MRAHNSGVLATVSRKFQGYPFGSVVPYVLDDSACPIILISSLAEHTKNLEADKRVSLLVQDPQADVQAGARLTFVGDAASEIDNAAMLRERYVTYFPDAARLVVMADFRVFRISPVALRFIGGFGDIHWTSAAEYAPPADISAVDGGVVVGLMNDVHADDLRLYCSRVLKQPVANAAAIAVDCDGVDVRADNRLLRIDFEEKVMAAGEAVGALLHVVVRARQP
jgi:putative heme iron utilization protein